MSWLWFLPLLFVVNVVSYPVLAWTQRRANRIDIDFKEDGKLLLAQVILCIKLQIIAIWYCADQGQGWLYLVPSCLTLVVALMLYFYIPLFLMKSDGEFTYRWAFGMRLLGLVTCVSLNFFKI
jgi:hypothetical protein